MIKKIATKPNQRFLWLDTCALIAISQNEKNAKENFLELTKKAEVEGILVMPCFGTDSLFEIRREKTFEDFLSFFNNYPCMLLSTCKGIVQSEHDASISKSKIDFRNMIVYVFVPEKEIKRLKLRCASFKDFVTKAMDVSNKNTMLAEEQEMTLLCEEILKGNNYLTQTSDETEGIRIFLSKILNQSIEKISLDNYPSLRLMRHCLIQKSQNKSTLLKRNDIYDVLLCSAIPYVNAIIIEGNQADKIQTAKSVIPQLDVQVFTINDLYNNQIEIH